MDGLKSLLIEQVWSLYPDIQQWMNDKLYTQTLIGAFTLTPISLNPNYMANQLHEFLCSTILFKHQNK